MPFSMIANSVAAPKRFDCTLAAREQPRAVSPHQLNTEVVMEQLRSTDPLKNGKNMSENFGKHDPHDIRHYHPTKRRRIEPGSPLDRRLGSDFAASTTTSLDNRIGNRDYQFPDEICCDPGQLGRTGPGNTSRETSSLLVQDWRGTLPDKIVSIEPNGLNDPATGIARDCEGGRTPSAGPYQNHFEAACPQVTNDSERFQTNDRIVGGGSQSPWPPFKNNSERYFLPDSSYQASIGGGLVLREPAEDMRQS
jgi:hypothetical protein